MTSLFLKERKMNLEQVQAIEYLRTFIKKGDVISTRVDSVAPSGLSRNIAFFCVDENYCSWTEKNKPRVRNISYQVAKALGYTYRPNSTSVHVKGCGMDMCWHSVHQLSYVLFGRDLPVSEALEEQRV